MSKIGKINELTNFLASALRHKIGAIVNPSQPYVQKYQKEADILFRKAKKLSLKINFNSYDKKILMEILSKRLKQELERCTYLDNKKFEMMDKEIEKVLKELGLD